MSKTNQTSSLATLENRDAIEDIALDSVAGAFNAVEHGATGGGRPGSWMEAMATAMGQAMEAQFQRQAQRAN